MKIKDYKFSFTELNITAEEVAFPMGYEEGGTPEEILDIIDAEMKQFADVTDICGAQQSFPVHFDKENKKMTIEKQCFDLDKSVYQFLKKSEQIVVFLCTAGKTISDRSQELMNNGDLMEGFVVDTIGSVATEKTMDIIHKKLEAELLEDGLKVTNRYSPGYCEWDVAEQQKLFQLYPEAYCGITLNESSLMSPIKSVSGFIGVGPEVSYKAYACDLCTQQNCIYSPRKRSQKG